MTKAEAIFVLEHIEAHNGLAKEAKLMAIDALKQPERKKGRWEMKWNCFFHAELPVCSQCLRFVPFKYDYCPWCSADMREEKTDDKKRGT